MDYPKSIKISYLQYSYPGYKHLTEVYTKIHHLCEGGHTIEAVKEQYLSKRPGEEQFIYEQRIKKFTYRNLLGSLIQQQASKLVAGTYTVSGLEDTPDFWNKYKEDVDLKGTEESDFLSKIFRQALQYQTVYIHVDKPRVNEPPKNKLQEELLGIRPYIVTYNASDVLDYEEDSKGNLKYIKVRQYSTYRPNIFSEPIPKITWTIITEEAILRYSALVKLGKDQKIISLIINGEEVPYSDDLEVTLESPPVLHGLSKFPVVRFSLPSDLWVSNQAYLKCLEYLNLDNVKYDSASLATYIQRTFKPYSTPIDQIPDIPEDAPPLTGNPYVIKGDFDFKEMSGSSLNVISTVLQNLEQEIKDIISLGVASSTKSALQQSGISKKLDLYREEILLRSYGRIILDVYQNILQLIALSAGLDPTSISCTGFTSFQLDSLDDYLTTADELMKIKSLLPPTALKLFIKELSKQMIPNASAEQVQTIEEEIEQINFSNHLTPVPAIIPVENNAA